MTAAWDEGLRPAMKRAGVQVVVVVVEEEEEEDVVDGLLADLAP